MDNPHTPYHLTTGPNRQQYVGIGSSGGTAPALNSVIGAAATELQSVGNVALGIHNGWDGWLEYREPVDFQSFTRDRLLGLFSKPGSILGNSRTKIKPEDHDRVLRTIKTYGLDGAIMIGGDDTLKQAAELDAALRGKGFPGGFINGVPKTIDNDVAGTDITFGHMTAYHEVAKEVRRIRADAKTMRRVGILEVQGRDAGWNALYGGYVGGADVTLIREFPLSDERVMQVIRETFAKQGHVMVAIAESYHSSKGATDSFNNTKHQDAGRNLATKVKEQTSLDTLVQVSGYFPRSRPPIGPDSVLAAEFGATAAYHANKGEYGLMMVQRDGRISHIDLSCAKGERWVTEEFYNPDTMRKWDLPPNIVRGVLDARRKAAEIVQQEG